MVAANILEAVANTVFVTWIVLNLVLMLHIAHQGFLVFNALRYRKKIKPDIAEEDLPLVTIQLPLYNEKYVVERLLDAMRELEYPSHLLEVQIIDDSVDETTEIIRKYIEHHQCNFELVGRDDRSGFKAGALAYGLKFAKGDVIAIFDADFIPANTFLLDTIPYFQDPTVGVVQARWLHINYKQSLLTRAQGLALDTHFSVEQRGRYQAGGFNNFNGTAGVWRKECIEDAGGWEADTLTEDLDLSFRAQVRGWRFEYLFDIGCPSELPSTFEAYRTQQFRWAKGPAECIRKNMALLWGSPVRFRAKLLGTLHLLNSSLYFLVVGLLLLGPAFRYVIGADLVTVPYYKYFLPLGPIVTLSIVFVFLTGTLISNKDKVNAMLWFLPSLMILFSMVTGISIHSCTGVIEGYWGRKSAFVRTPKFGDEGVTKKIQNGYKEYNKEYGIIRKLLEFMCWGYGVYLCYLGFQAVDPMTVAYALYLVIGFSLSLFFKSWTF